MEKINCPKCKKVKMEEKNGWLICSGCGYRPSGSNIGCNSNYEGFNPPYCNGGCNGYCIIKCDISDGKWG